MDGIQGFRQKKKTLQIEEGYKMDISYNDLESKAQQFCDAIRAKLIYTSGDKFVFKMETGETQSLYWYELDRVMSDLGIMQEMRRSREARRHDYDYKDLLKGHKIEGQTWSIFLNNLEEEGFTFNDVYYDMPHKFIDAFRGDDELYQIKVKTIDHLNFDTYEVEDITMVDPDEIDKMDVIEESQKRQIFREAQRFTHRIVLLPKGTHYHLNKRFADQLRFYSAEEAEKKKAELDAGSFGAKLQKLGLSLGVEEIEKKPRHTGTEDPDYENPFEVGDILFGDVGYSMSIPEWWQVIKKTDKSVTCRRLATDIVEHDGYGQRGTEVPIRGVFDKRGGTVNGKPSDAPVTMRVKKWSGQVAGWHKEGKDQYYASLGGSRYGHIFSLWDGKPKGFDYYD